MIVYVYVIFWRLQNSTFLTTNIVRLSFINFLLDSVVFSAALFYSCFFLLISSAVLMVKAHSNSKVKYSKGKKCHTYKIPLRGNSWVHCQLLFLKYNYHITSDNVAFCAVEHFVYARESGKSIICLSFSTCMSQICIHDYCSLSPLVCVLFLWSEAKHGSADPPKPEYCLVNNLISHSWFTSQVYSALNVWSSIFQAWLMMWVVIFN